MPAHTGRMIHVAESTLNWRVVLLRKSRISRAKLLKNTAFYVVSIANSSAHRQLGHTTHLNKLK
jgi:hypothetical protein